jgi:hypothetical protein
MLEHGNNHRTKEQEQSTRRKKVFQVLRIDEKPEGIVS